jgi:secreted trypsin-like serine protease
MRRVLTRRVSTKLNALRVAIVCLLSTCMPAIAMVGNAPVASGSPEKHVVMIVGSRGTSCSATAIGRDLLLTAAHCVLAGADYKLVALEAGVPTLKDITAIARHPRFELKSLLAHRASADVAVLKLAAPLPAKFTPAAIAQDPAPTKAGGQFLVAGFGVSVRGDGKSGGTLRSATLVATGRPGNLQLRLVDPATNNERPGRGACTGDSGAPVFDASDGRLALIGVVSWSTGPGNSAGCGGLTGVTPLSLYRDWIVETARKLGNAL